MGFQTETPLGRIITYSALSTPAAILGSLASEASPAMQAAQKSGIPLSVSESTGRFSGLEKMLTTGSAGSMRLGMEQDAAAQSAIEKIIGAPLDQSLDVVLQGTKLQKEVRTGIVKPWVNAWKQANAVTTETPTVTGGAGFAGDPTKVMVSKTRIPKDVNWQDFQDFFGLSREERDGFFRAIQAQPEQFINQLMPSNENQVRGLLKLRGLMTVLENSGHETEAGQLGSAFVMRYLRGPAELGQAINGHTIAQRIETALPGHLTVALGPERTQALADLATVLDKADPLEKVASLGVSAQKRAAQYMTNKLIFATMSTAAMGAAGSSVPGGTLLMGIAGGATVGLGLPTVLGALMTNPKTGKLLIAASKGDITAATRFVRTITSAKESADERGETFELSSPSTRLTGLFKKQ
jgi:hypothetical protein